MEKFGYVFFVVGFWEGKDRPLLKIMRVQLYTFDFRLVLSFPSCFLGLCTSIPRFSYGSLSYDLRCVDFTDCLYRAFQ